MNIDGVGAWPPVYESHVEMDGAWALFEAWLRLQLGDIDVALVIGSGKSSPGRPARGVPAPDRPVRDGSARARSRLARRASRRGRCSTRARPASGTSPRSCRRSRRDALQNPHAQVAKDATVDDLLGEPYFSAPLRTHDLAADLRRRRGGDHRRAATGPASSPSNPVWIRGIDHRIESHHPGLRDLTDSASTKLAAEKVGAGTTGPIDVAELMVNYSPEELILRDALGLGDDANVNPSGGPLAGHPVMATGLDPGHRGGATASRTATASRGVAHASSGPCLQQNLLCVLEGGD